MAKGSSAACETRARADEAASRAMGRYAAGDDAAFEDLYDLLAPRLYAYLVKRTGDREAARDLLQQTLLQLHRGRGSFIVGADVLPWALAIARRLTIDSLRSATRDTRLSAAIEHAGDEPRDASVDEIAEARQLAGCVERELARLPPQQREAYVLVDQRAVSLLEAAHRLNVTIGAVKLRIHRAREALRAAVTRHEGLAAPPPRR